MPKCVYESERETLYVSLRECVCLCDKERESRFWFGSDPKIWVSSLLAIRNGHSRKKELRVSERESVRKERERECSHGLEL